MDFLAIVVFFVAFWLIDRTESRLRFLVGYGYFALLPIALLIWRAAQGVVEPKDISWWSTVWPFFILAIVFFVFEIIALTATRGTDHHTVPAIKDAIFVIAFAILLLIAMLAPA